MSQQVDLTQYLTRHQSDTRYGDRFLLKPTPPLPPSLSFLVKAPEDHWIITSPVDQSAYLDLLVVDPAKPLWATQDAYIQAYSFDVTYTVGTGSVTLTFLISKRNVYRVYPLPANVSVSVSASTIDYLGQRSLPSAPIFITTDKDTVAPAPAMIVGSNGDVGALIAIASGLNQESDFNHYELWRGRGYNLVASSWSIPATKVLDFYSTLILDQSIPTTASDYFYYVNSVDSSTNFASSNVFGPLSLIGTGLDAPPAPSLVGASVSVNSNGSLSFKFNGLSALLAPALTKYRIWRKNAAVGWVLIDTISAVPNGAQVAYVDVRTINGQTYTYAVSAVNLVNDESSYDATSTITGTANITDVPGTPANLVFAGRLGGIDLLWTRSGTSTVKYYKVRYKASGIFKADGSDFLLVEGNTYTIYGLTQTRDQLAGNLMVEVVAYDGVNLSATLPGTVTYPALANYVPADNSLPPAPANQVATTNLDGSVDITWDAPVIPDLLGYELDIQERPSGGSAGLWQLLGTVMDDSFGGKRFTDVGLEPFSFNPIEYRYRVRSLDKSGNISPFNLLDNPDFIDGSLSWIGGVLVADVTKARSGINCIRSGYSTWSYQAVPCVTGLPYSMSAHVRQDVDAGNVKIRISFQDIGNVWLGTFDKSSSTIGVTSGYQRLSVTAIAPPGAVKANLVLDGDPLQVTKTYLWDDCQIEQNYEASAYSSGRTPFVRSVDLVGPPDYSPVLTTIAGLGMVGLRWNNPGATFKDYIYGVIEIWRSSDGITFTKLDEVSANNDASANSYDDNQPDENVASTYWYKLRPRDRFGNGLSVSLADPTPKFLTLMISGTGYASIGITSKTFNDLLPPPAQPTGLPSVVANAAGTITVSWALNGESNIGGYRIWRADNAGNTLLLATKASLSLTYIDTQTVEGVGYKYAIVAYNKLGSESPIGAYNAAFVVSHDSTAPPLPGNLVITGGLGSMRIDWDTVVGAVSYNVECSKDGVTFNPSGFPMGIALGAGYSFFGFTDLRSAMTSFTARVTAKDAGNNTSVSSAVISAASLNGYQPGSLIAPNDPAGWSSAVTPSPDGTILLAWLAPVTTPSLAGFVVEQQETTATGNPAVNPAAWEQLALLQSPATLQYRASGLEPFKVRNRQYNFRVRSLDTTGRISAGTLVSGWQHSIDTTGPADYPTLGLVANAGLGAISLRWFNAPSTMPDYFQGIIEVWRALDAGFTSTVKKLADVPCSSDGYPNSFDDFDPPDNVATTFYYRLLPRDRFGNRGAYLQQGSGSAKTVFNTSLTTGATLQDGLSPTVPVVDHVDLNDDGTVTIWVRESSTSGRNDLAGYNLWRKEHTDLVYANYRKISSILVRTLSGTVAVKDAAPISGRSYDYVVSAFDNQIDESAKSTELLNVTPSYTLAPLPPSNFKGVAAIGRVDLNWTASPSPGVTYYQIDIPASGVVAAQSLRVTGTSLSLPLPFGPTKEAVQVMGGTVLALRDGSGVQSITCALGIVNISNYVAIDSTAPDPPGAPTVVSLTPTQLVLGWVPSAAPDVAKYVVEALVAGGWYSVGSGVGNSKGCLVTGLNQGTGYQFRVWAVDFFNNSTCSQVSALINIPVTPPTNQNPSTLAINAITAALESGNQTSAITVTWSKSIDSDFGHYELQINIGGTVIMAPTSVGADVNTLTYVVHGMTNNTTYTAFVRMMDQGGLAGNWASANVATPATPIPTNYTPIVSVSGYDDTDIRGGWGSEIFDFTCTNQSGAAYVNPPGFAGMEYFYSFDNINWTMLARSATVSFTTSFTCSAVARIVYFLAMPADSSGNYLTDWSNKITTTVDAKYYVPPTCPAVDQYILPKLLAGQGYVGLSVEGVTDSGDTPCFWSILSFGTTWANCVRIETVNGAAVVVSQFTPVKMRNGLFLNACDVDGKDVLTDVGNGLEWSQCTVEACGYREVAQIDLGGHVYRAASQAGKWIYTHNLSVGG